MGTTWSSLTAFVRIATHPRALIDPLSPVDAWQLADEWLDAPTVWVPGPGRGHREILGRPIAHITNVQYIPGQGSTMS